jgi:hypothetical protein
MKRTGKLGLSVFFFSLALVGFLLLDGRGAEIGPSVEKAQLASALEERDLETDAFIAPAPGQAIELSAGFAVASGPVNLEASVAGR